ncbi:glutamine amidotransferase-related protein [Thalassolituus sp. LLYu03]|uniref:glutamine amidotransferase-related protein n=1 Tax=Thalassolituus sp. LLYu03 TaxID=3421656 RepID=UPI003D28B404
MKTLGLLETDTLYDDLLADYTSYGTMFTRYFAGLGVGLNYRFYQVQQGELPADLNECDAYLITGSKAGVYDNLPWIAPLQDWIRDAYAHKRKLIGICFGHQLLAHTLGGHAARSPKGWGIGVHSTRIEHHPVWMNDDLSHMRLIYSHRDQVEQLPPAATRMASSEFCENAAFYIGQQVMAFQGHPEFTAEYARRLLPRRENCIGPDVFQRGMCTLEQPNDSARVGRWLGEFIALP